MLGISHEKPASTILYHPHLRCHAARCARTTGQQRLHETVGVFVPQPYERILEIMHKILVLPHQAVDSRFFWMI